MRRWEFDIGWFYLKIFSALGLARVLRVAPVPTIDTSKNMIDLETVKAVLSSRLHVMEHYARKVILPEQKAQARAAETPETRKKLNVRKELVSVSTLLDDSGRQRLSSALESSDVLRTVIDCLLYTSPSPRDS